MSIGIILTLSFEDEITKNEIIEIDTIKRPWLSNVHPSFVISHNDKHYVSDDVSIGYFIKNSTNVPVNFIMLDSATAEKEIQTNVVNFLVIYDLLEAFHTLPEHKFKKVQYLLKQPNVYPPFDYQYFVNHKPVYYEYLRSKGVPVLPSVHITYEEFQSNRDSAMERVINLEKGDQGKIICKPVYGQEGKGYIEFHGNVKPSRIEAELEQMFRIYKGVIFQPYVDSFRSNEYKFVFVGNELTYCMAMNFVDYDHKVIKESDRPDVFTFAKNVFSKLPKIQVNGVEIPRLLTRVDVGCCYKSSTGYFLSEVEFVPSLFIDYPEVNALQIDKLLGQQMLVVFESFKKLQQKNIQMIFEQKKSKGMERLHMIFVILFLLVVIFMIMKVKWKKYAYPS